METTTNTGKKKKIQWESARKKGRSHLNYKLFSENFVQYSLKKFSKPMGDINIRRM